MGARRGEAQEEQHVGGPEAHAGGREAVEHVAARRGARRAHVRQQRQQAQSEVRAAQRDQRDGLRARRLRDFRGNRVLREVSLQADVEDQLRRDAQQRHGVVHQQVAEALNHAEGYSAQRSRVQIMRRAMPRVEAKEEKRE